MTIPAPLADTHVVLVGMMGSGKSTVGQLLAERLGWSYLDNDADVRSLTAREPRDVIATAGEETLHEAEASALQLALRAPGPAVVGAAAGVILDPTCAALLRQERSVVYLRARAQTLHDRIGSGEGRRHDATDAAWLSARLDERDERYRDLADLTLDVDALAPDEVVESIMTWLAGSERQPQ